MEAEAKEKALTEPAVLNFEQPQYSIVSTEGPDGRLFLGLMINTSSTQHLCYLCAPEDADKTARIFGQQITRAGADARRQNKPSLITGTGMEGFMQNGQAKSPRPQGG